MDPLILTAGAAALGSIAQGSLGWFDAGGPFNGRKFAGNCIRALISGVTLALGQSLAGYSGVALYFLAFLSGAGVDSLLNHAQGGVSRGPADEQIVELRDKLEKMLARQVQTRTSPAEVAKETPQ